MLIAALSSPAQGTFLSLADSTLSPSLECDAAPLVPFPHSLVFLPHPYIKLCPSDRFVPHMRGLKQEQMEQILDRFDAREEFFEGHQIINQVSEKVKECRGTMDRGAT